MSVSQSAQRKFLRPAPSPPRLSACMINYVSIPSPRATILLSKWLFILSIPSWCSTKDVHEVISFLSVTPYFPQTRVPGACYGNHWGTKVGVTRRAAIAIKKLNYGQKISEKICNFESTLESRVRYQADVNFQDLSEIVKAAVSLNEKALHYDRRIKINQKRLMNC